MPLVSLYTPGTRKKAVVRNELICYKLTTSYIKKQKFLKFVQGRVQKHYFGIETFLKFTSKH